MPLHRGPMEQPVCHFTTYDVAFFFHISAPTARKWISKQLIKGCFQLPESNEWRVPAHELLAFAKERKLPTPEIMVDSAALYLNTYTHDGTDFSKNKPTSTSPATQVSTPTSTQVSSESYANKVIPAS